MITVLLTGATSGLGRALATALADRDATVLVHGRDQQKIDATVADLPGARGYQADLASLAEVNALADEVLAKEGSIDVLINNAGVASTQRQDSADGIELDFAVNHLAGFVLTGRLLPRLSRVVNVASAGQAPIDWDEPLLGRGWDGFRAYAQSKLAQIMFTFDLAEREPDLIVNALHPATLMDTRMVRESFGRAHTKVEDGVGPTVRLALDETTSGSYFDQNKPGHALPQAYDREERAKLWRLSVQLAASDPYG